MRQFIAKYARQVAGVLSGFDRLVLRGSLRRISYEFGMMGYLWANQVRLTEFGKHAQEVSEAVKTASLREASETQRPIQYLTSSRTNKEEVARAIAERDGVRDGLVCVLTCVEPCLSYDIHRNGATKQLDLVMRTRKCLFLYHYWIHPKLGFLNARIQTWFPFPVQVCLNGREWLARQMQSADIDYQRSDNCFPWVADYGQAQQLLNAQLKVSWPSLLNGIARQLNPIHDQIFRALPTNYYWSTFQSEWATDVVFHDAEQFRRLYPLLVQHGITTFSSPDVMRFLGHKMPAHGWVSGHFEGEVVSDVKRRPEGVRIKHRAGGNSVKLYDKAQTARGNVMRFETTINNERGFQVFRPKEGEPGGKKEWRKMRKGIADLHRRAEVSQGVNDRYLKAISSVDDSTTLQECSAPLEKRVRWNGKWMRALHPFATEDAALLQAISQGSFLIHGVRNRELCPLLFSSTPSDPQQARRRSAAVSRKLRLLRAHGLLFKVAHTHRYHLTDLGRQVCAAVLAARQTPINLLRAKVA
jgi:hypothetical protein